MVYKFEPACNRMEWLDPFYKQVWQKAFDDAIPISGTLPAEPEPLLSNWFIYSVRN